MKKLLPILLLVSLYNQSTVCMNTNVDQLATNLHTACSNGDTKGIITIIKSVTTQSMITPELKILILAGHLKNDTSPLRLLPRDLIKHICSYDNQAECFSHLIQLLKYQNAANKTAGELFATALMRYSDKGYYKILTNSNSAPTIHSDILCLLTCHHDFIPMDEKAERVRTLLRLIDTYKTHDIPGFHTTPKQACLLS